MAKKKEDGVQEETLENSSSKTLASILKEHKDEHYNFQENVTWKISSGSILIDSEIGGIGPSLIRLCGENNEGKTPQALEILRNFLATVPNSKGFWMIAEGRGLSKENKERCGLKFVYKPEEWEVGTVFVLESNVFELFIKNVKTLVLSNESKEKYCFVVDSVDGLQLRDDKAKDITENNKVAGVPSLSKKMFQNLSLGMFKYGHLMIFISQVTAEIKLDTYSKSPNRGGNFSGGNTLLHSSDWIFEFQKTYNGDYILDNPSGKMNDNKSKAIGKWAKVLLVKSVVETARKKLITYPIKFGRKPSGIWLEREIADMLLSLELMKAGGAWLTLDESLVKEMQAHNLEDIQVKFQGMENFRKYLEEHPKIVEFLFPKVVNFNQIISEEMVS